VVLRPGDRANPGPAMTLHLVFGCDGTRNEMACRGAFHTRDHDAVNAYKEANKAGWRKRYISGKGLWICPSGGHNEDKQ
jgi:hypothetical protein